MYSRRARRHCGAGNQRAILRHTDELRGAYALYRQARYRLTEMECLGEELEPALFSGIESKHDGVRARPQLRQLYRSLRILQRDLCDEWGRRCLFGAGELDPLDLVKGKRIAPEDRATCAESL